MTNRIIVKLIGKELVVAILAGSTIPKGWYLTPVQCNTAYLCDVTVGNIMDVKHYMASLGKDNLTYSI